MLILVSAFLAQQVLIPEGTFTMGRTKVTADDNTKMRPHVLLDDRPPHAVKLKAFKLDAKEVTHEEYAAFVAATKRATPYHWTQGKMPQHLARVPAYNVTWEDARAYCEWKQQRLPTEAEWERAARGGLDSQSYPWGDRADAKTAWYAQGSGPGPVGRYKPNAFGLYDMAGNVSEWTADWFSGGYYKESPAENPKGPETGVYKVIRGGAWSDPASRITVFFRNWVRPTQRQPNIGFRCAAD